MKKYIFCVVLVATSLKTAFDFAKKNVYIKNRLLNIIKQKKQNIS